MNEEAISIALELIQHYEGFVPHVYRDSAGYATIGFGNLWRPGMPEQVTREEALEMARRVLEMDSLFLEKQAPGLNAFQHAAMLSFIYNVGRQKFMRSSIRVALRRKHYEQIPDLLMKWVRAAGKVLKGLQRRRMAEALVFQGVPVPEAIRRAKEAYP